MRRGPVRTGETPVPPRARSSAQFAQEFLLIHAVFKRFAAIDEDHGDLVGIEAADFRVRVYIDFAPGKAAMLLQLDDALFDDFAEMTSLAGVNHDFPRRRHARECSSFGAVFPIYRMPGSGSFCLTLYSQGLCSADTLVPPAVELLQTPGQECPRYTFFHVLAKLSHHRRPDGVPDQDGVEFPHDDQRTATFRKDNTGHRSSETTGSSHSIGRCRKRRRRGHYLSAVSAGGTGGGRD